MAPSSPRHSKNNPRTTQGSPKSARDLHIILLPHLLLPLLLEGLPNESELSQTDATEMNRRRNKRTAKQANGAGTIKTTNGAEPKRNRSDSEQDRTEWQGKVSDFA